MPMIAIGSRMDSSSMIIGIVADKIVPEVVKIKIC